MARKKKDGPALMVPADLETSLAPQRLEAEEALKMIKDLNLTTQDKRDMAGRVVVAIRARRAKLDEERKGITGPMLEAKRRVDALFKPIDEYWGVCDAALSERLLEATRAADAAQVQALAEVAATKGHTTSNVLAMAHDPATTPAGLDLRRTWSFRITDPSLIPDEYWKVDEDKIKRVVVAARGEIEIPGVVVEQEQSFARARGSA